MNLQAKNREREALIRLSLDYIDAALNAVADSTGAVAGEFVRAHEAATAMSEQHRDYWRERHLVKEDTVLFQTWPGDLQPSPAYQSDTPAIYAYQGENFTDATYRELEILQGLIPVVRAAYRSYPYSWSYITTAKGMMLLYPFLTLDEAVNNQSPTQQIYYRHADFEHRRAGWTPPYLDLVGAGMMVTVSTPAYQGDQLLGVVSHDITLDQLSRSVMASLARDVGGVAWLVDGSGLVIAVSDANLARELTETNQAAGEAVLHYRNPQALQRSVEGSAKASQTHWINEITEEMLNKTHSAGEEAVEQLTHEGVLVLSGKSNVTNWLLLWKAQTN